MNGADMLCDVLLVNDVDVCFANPGTSEMHFVAALDRKPQMRCVLGLFEGVVTGAADGYGRMTGRPAATLLHTGPGLANGLANLHNARRARTPIINITGDHATHHLVHDAPLTTDIESLARPMSHWVGRVQDAADIRPRTEAALRAATSLRGVATLILPADAAWGEVAPVALAPVVMPPPPPVAPEQLAAAVAALRSGRKAVILLAGRALRAEALLSAGRIAAVTGADLVSQTSDRTELGAGRVPVRRLPYPLPQAITMLRDYEVAICVGGKAPVAFFAYPDKPALVLQPECEVVDYAAHEHDLAAAVAELAEALGAKPNTPVMIGQLRQADIAPAAGRLSPETIAIEVARHLPENAIICDESITSGGRLAPMAAQLPPHDFLPLTGGAIGVGIPLAVGAAIACPDRKVIALQADGSGLYTVQGLWTQARENLDVVTVIYANQAYAILQGEMRSVGVNDFGVNARKMLDLDSPAPDWCHIARGFGVEAARATTVEAFSTLLRAALARRGPFLIEAMI